PQLLQPGGEQEVAQGEPCVQDRPRNPLWARCGQGQRGNDGIRDRSFRAMLLHDGGSSFSSQPNDDIRRRTTVNFQRSEGQPQTPTARWECFLTTVSPRSGMTASTIKLSITGAQVQGGCWCARRIGSMTPTHSDSTAGINSAKRTPAS